MFKEAGKAAKDELFLFKGKDEQFVVEVSLGQKAGIGGTYGVMPELFLKKLNYLNPTGEREKATELQYDINEIIYKMCSSHANMYAVGKRDSSY